MTRRSLYHGWDEECRSSCGTVRALELEQQQSRDVLLPIQLDDALQSSPHSWAISIRRERNVGDFRAQPDQKAYAKAFARLLTALRPKARN